MALAVPSHPKGSQLGRRGRSGRGQTSSPQPVVTGGGAPAAPSRGSAFQRMLGISPFDRAVRQRRQQIMKASSKQKADMTQQWRTHERDVRRGLQKYKDQVDRYYGLHRGRSGDPAFDRAAKKAQQRYALEEKRQLRTLNRKRRKAFHELKKHRDAQLKTLRKDVAKPQRPGAPLSMAA